MREDFSPSQARLGRGTTRRVVEGYCGGEYPSTMLCMVPLPIAAQWGGI